MARILSVLITGMLLCTCVDKNITREFNNLQTQQIDTKEYERIKQTFSFWEVREAPDNLGGLDSAYSLALAYAQCDNTSYCREADWRGGGFICLCRNIVIKNKRNFKIIGSKSELKQTFAPIESRTEALSYAILMTRLYPVFDKSYFKDSYRYYGAKPTTTIVQEFDNYYLVQLFDYKVFGCDHPYYSVLVQVEKDGSIKERRRRKAFEDPDDDALCVD